MVFLPSNVSFLRKPKAGDKKEEDDEGTLKFEDTHILVKEKKILCNAVFEKHLWATSSTVRLNIMLMATLHIPIVGAIPKDYPQSHRLTRA